MLWLHYAMQLIHFVISLKVYEAICLFLLSLFVFSVLFLLYSIKY